MRHMTSAFVMVLALALAGCATHGALPALPPLHADAAAEIVVIREARIFGAGLTFYITLDRTPVYARGNDQHAVIPMAAGQHLLGIAAGGWNGGVKLIQPTAQQRLYCRVNSAPVTTGLSLEAVSADAGQATQRRDIGSASMIVPRCFTVIWRGPSDPSTPRDRGRLVRCDCLPSSG